jgi:hypothetical protein
MRPAAVFLITSVLAMACGRRGSPPEPAPAAKPSPSPRPWVAPEPVDWDRPLRVCIVRNGALVQIPVHYDSDTGDTTTLERLPLSHEAPLTGEYAAVAGWYVRNELIVFRGLRYVKYGLPREIWPTDLARVGEYRGVGVFADAADTASIGFIYLPVRPGCSFQPYEPPHRQE